MKTKYFSIYLLSLGLTICSCESSFEALLLKQTESSFSNQTANSETKEENDASKEEDGKEVNTSEESCDFITSVKKKVQEYYDNFYKLDKKPDSTNEEEGTSDHDELNKEEVETSEEIVNTTEDKTVDETSEKSDKENSFSSYYEARWLFDF